MTVCPKCGLPAEACICKELTKTGQKIMVERAKRRFGKIVTLVSGIEEDLKENARKLKQALACGGTVKNGVIELQGDHARKAKDLLISLGFSEENISVAE